MTYESFLDSPGSRQYDGYLMILCPWHNDHAPSLMVWPDNHFKCLSCGERGGYKKLHDKLNGFVYNVAPIGYGATPSMAGKSSEDVAMEAHMTLKSFPQFNAYMERRGVGPMNDKGTPQSAKHTP